MAEQENKLSNQTRKFEDEKNDLLNQISDLGPLQKINQNLEEKNIELENEKNELLKDKMQMAEEHKNQISIQNLESQNQKKELQMSNNELLSYNQELELKNKRFALSPNNFVIRYKKKIFANNRGFFQKFRKNKFIFYVTSTLITKCIAQKEYIYFYFLMEYHNQAHIQHLNVRAKCDYSINITCIMLYVMEKKKLHTTVRIPMSYI